MEAIHKLMASDLISSKLKSRLELALILTLILYHESACVLDCNLKPTAVSLHLSLATFLASMDNNNKKRWVFNLCVGGKQDVLYSS